MQISMGTNDSQQSREKKTRTYGFVVWAMISDLPANARES